MTTRTFRRTAIVWVLALGLVAGACTSSDGGEQGGGAADEAEGFDAPTTKMTGEYATDLDLQVDPDEETAPASFEAVAGTEEVTVTGVEAGDPGLQGGEVALRAVGSTGSPLPEDAYHWLWDKLPRPGGQPMWIACISGGMKRFGRRTEPAGPSTRK